MIAILRRRKLGNGSTKAIKMFLKNNHDKDIEIVRSDRIPDRDFDAVLRWGCTENFRHAPICINTPEMIHTVNDKPGCRKALIEEGINCPKTWFDKDGARQEVGRAGEINKIIGRPAHHAQGRKMVVSSNLLELERDTTSDYWSKIIEKDHEYRVYTFFGRIIMVAEKVPTEVGRERLAWNHFGGGAVFNNVRWSDWPIECCKESLKAANVIGIDFAGVDVIEKDGVPYILEINSAHSLTAEYRQKTFAKALSWLIDQIETTHEKPVHFDYPEHIRTYKSLILPHLRDR